MNRKRDKCGDRCPEREVAGCDRPPGHANLHSTILFGSSGRTYRDVRVFWGADRKVVAADAKLLPDCACVSSAGHVCTRPFGHDGHCADGKAGHTWDPNHSIPQPLPPPPADLAELGPPKMSRFQESDQGWRQRRRG